MDKCIKLLKENKKLLCSKLRIDAYLRNYVKQITKNKHVNHNITIKAIREILS